MTTAIEDPDVSVAPAETEPLRLVTWNLNHWRQPLLPTDTRRAAWAHLVDLVGAQVALVQEAGPPAETPRDRAVYGELAGHRNWGSGEQWRAKRPARCARTRGFGRGDVSWKLGRPCDHGLMT